MNFARLGLLFSRLGGNSGGSGGGSPPPEGYVPTYHIIGF